MFSTYCVLYLNFMIILYEASIIVYFRNKFIKIYFILSQLPN